MRNTKLHQSLALCLSLSLGGLTACDIELPKPGESEEGETLKEKVVDTVNLAQQGSGEVELRMVEQDALSARAFPALDTSDMEAVITVKAIGVRLCLQEPPVDADTDDAEVEAPVVEQETEPDGAEPEGAEPEGAEQEGELPSDPESDEDPSQEGNEVSELGVSARKGKKARPKGPRDEEDKPDQDRLPIDPADEVEPEDDFGLPDDIDLPDGFDVPDKAGKSDEALDAQRGLDGDTVATDEELAEDGDAQDACRNSKWIWIKQDALEIDLLNLGNMDAGGLLAKGELPVGTYRGIRIVISDAKIRVADEEVGLKIPSGKASGLKIRAGFEVQDDGLVEIDLGFDLGNSLRQHPKHGWMLRPVLRAQKRRQ